MSPKPPPPSVRNSLSLKVGSWFEANATGWGVLAIPIVVLLLAAAAVARILVTG